MEKIVKISYVSVDGEEFSTEEECLAHEKLFRVPAGVVLMDNEFGRITDTDDLDICYFAFLPTEEDVEWFRGASEIYGLVSEGTEAGEHLWYDKSSDAWRSYERDIKEAQENIRKFEEFSKL